MAGIGFCLPWLSLLRRPNNTTKADFFPHHFGEGIALSQEFVNAGGQRASYFQTFGHLLLTARDLAGFVFGAIAFCLGALMYYSVFYQSKLIPRWLSVWGLIATVLLLSAVLLTLFDGEPFSISGGLIILALPIAVQEMVLAVWLIVKGFNPSAIADSLPTSC